jgi:membrane protein
MSHAARDRAEGWPHLRPLGELARQATADFRADGCMDYAASISFHVLLSIFPLAILVTSVSSVVVLGGPSGQREVLDEVVRLVPLAPAGRRDVHHLITTTTSSGAFNAVSALGLAWAATGMMAALRSALDRAWGVRQPRPFLRGKLYDILLVVGSGVVFLAATVLVFLSHVRVAGTGGGGAAAAVIPFLAVFLAYAFLFRIVPSCRPGMRSVAVGAAAGAVAFTVLEHGFAAYVAHLASFNRVYGTLATPVALLVFVYLAAITLLWCAELAAILDGSHARRG